MGCPTAAQSKDRSLSKSELAKRIESKSLLKSMQVVRDSIDGGPIPGESGQGTRLTRMKTLSRGS